MSATVPAEIPSDEPIIATEDATGDAHETDSGFGDNSSTYTESIRSSLLESLKENGRGYHKVLVSTFGWALWIAVAATDLWTTCSRCANIGADRSENTYILPEDQREQDRLDLQHALFLLSSDDKLALAPVGDNLRNVLDLGTGTGIWAIDFADQHPEADVLGIDLSAIQPSWVNSPLGRSAP